MARIVWGQRGACERAMGGRVRGRCQYRSLSRLLEKQALNALLGFFADCVTKRSVNLRSRRDKQQAIDFVARKAQTLRWRMGRVVALDVSDTWEMALHSVSDMAGYICARCGGATYGARWRTKSAWLSWVSGKSCSSAHSQKGTYWVIAV